MDIALERVERERGAPLQRPAALPRMRFKATPGMAQPAVLDMGPGPEPQRGVAGSTASKCSPGWQPWIWTHCLNQLCFSLNMPCFQAMRQLWRSLLPGRKNCSVARQCTSPGRQTLLMGGRRDGGWHSGGGN